MDDSFGHFTCIRIQCKSTVGNSYNGSSLHVKYKMKNFFGKTLGNFKTFLHVSNGNFLNIHMLTGLCDAKDTFLITSGGTFSRQI